MWLNWKVVLASVIAVLAVGGTYGKDKDRLKAPNPQERVSTISSPDVVLGDELHWYVIRGSWIIKVRKTTNEVVRSASARDENGLLNPRRYPDAEYKVKNVTIKADQEDVHDLLGRFFKIIDAKHTIDPELQGSVTISLVNTPIERVLDLILRQVDGSFKFNNGAFHVEPWKSPFAELTMSWASNPLPTYKLEGEYIAIFVGPFVINFSTERMRSEGVFRIANSRASK